MNSNTVFMYVCVYICMYVRSTYVCMHVLFCVYACVYVCCWLFITVYAYLPLQSDDPNATIATILDAAKQLVSLSAYLYCMYSTQKYTVLTF